MIEADNVTKQTKIFIPILNWILELGARTILVFTLFYLFGADHLNFHAISWLQSLLVALCITLIRPEYQLPQNWETFGLTLWLRLKLPTRLLFTLLLIKAILIMSAR